MRVLGLLRVHVDPADQDQVRPAIGEEEVAVLVDAADVAVGGPAPLVPRRRGLRRLVAVLEGAGPGEPHRAGDAGRHLLPVVVDDVHLAQHGVAPYTEQDYFAYVDDSSSSPFGS